MQSAIEKFESFLNDVESQFNAALFMDNLTFIGNRFSKGGDNLSEESREGIDLHLRQITFLKRMLIVPREYWTSMCNFFNSFDLLSEFLCVSNLKKNEWLEVILQAIEMNMVSGVLSANAQMFEAKKFMDFPFKTMTHQEAVDYIQKDNIRELLFKDEEELTERQRMHVKEIYEHIDEFVIDAFNTTKNNETVYNHLIKKRDEFTLEDVEVSIKALRNLNVPENVLSNFRGILKSEIEKREKKHQKLKQKSEIKIPFKNEKKSSKHYITDKEYRDIKKKILEYYDLYHMTFNKEDITYDEVIYCASLMIQIDIPKDEVINFIRKYYYFVYSSEENSVLEYVRFIAKLEYYLDKEDLELAHECFEELWICDEESYAFWKEALENELSKLRPAVNGKYDYEYQLAKSNKSRL